MFNRILFFIPVLLFCEEAHLSSILVADGFTKPVYVCQPPVDKNRLFVLEQKGVIRIIERERTVRQPFADLRDRVHNPVMPGDERGLLGLAFHPDYQTNGFLFLNYIDEEDNTIISRFRVSKNPDKLDAASEKILIQLKQPYTNHNGGHMVFGPDGYLYIGLGDGGKWGDPFNRAQRLDNLFGKLLRINVNKGEPYSIPKDNPFIGVEGAREEICMYGFRNP